MELKSYIFIPFHMIYIKQDFDVYANYSTLRNKYFSFMFNVLHLQFGFGLLCLG